MQGSGDVFGYSGGGCIYWGLDVSWETSGRKRGKVDGKSGEGMRRGFVGLYRLMMWLIWGVQGRCLG